MAPDAIATKPSGNRRATSRNHAPVSAVWSSLGFGPTLQSKADTAPGVGWLPVLSLNASVALLLASYAANASRSGDDTAVTFFYLAISLMFVPVAARLIHPAAGRHERIGLVLLATLALFLVRVIRAPIAFVDHDEFLHWLTAIDILERRALFTDNPLLPVSPLYPGLELVSTAISGMTGLSIFVGGLIFLSMARLTFVAALYLFYERISESPRIASIASLAYMGSSTFVIFDSHFAYESLAVVLLALTLLSEAVAHQTPKREWRITVGLTFPFLFALSLTHHMTAFFAAVLLTALAVLRHLQAGGRSIQARECVVALAAIILPTIWSAVMDNPTAGYLGPVIADGLHEAAKLFASGSTGRQFFVSADGSLAPFWQRSVTISSVILICIGLATGFIRALVRAGLPETPAMFLRFRGLISWHNSWIVLLTGLTLAYPLSILFRLTSSGWEIGNRVGPFSFLGVAIVIGIAINGFWQAQSANRLRAVVLGLCCTIVLVGGMISAEGPRILVPKDFKVSADSASVEPMGIGAAEWAATWLGPGNTFASDRINRLLLATYGRQNVATTLQDSRDVSIAMQAKTLGVQERNVLKQLGIDYILSDLRLTTALPVVGVYFDGGAADRGHIAPLSTVALLKFNAELGVSRTFDNGYEIIYNLAGLHDH